MDLHNSIIDLHNYGIFMEIHNWYLWISIIRIMEIHNHGGLSPLALHTKLTCIARDVIGSHISWHTIFAGCANRNSSWITRAINQLIRRGVVGVQLHRSAKRHGRHRGEYSYSLLCVHGQSHCLTVGFHLAFYGANFRHQLIFLTSPASKRLQNGCRTETGHIRRGKCWPRLFSVFGIFSNRCWF